MKDIYRLLAIKKLNTTAYHPQRTGMIECFNHTLKIVLRKHVDVLVISRISFFLGYYGLIEIPFMILWRRSHHSSVYSKIAILGELANLEGI